MSEKVSELRLKRVRNVPHGSDTRGWVTHKVVAERDNRKVGHITISWIPDFDKRFPTQASLEEAFPHHGEERLHRLRSFHAFPFVAMVDVASSCRRQGIGLALYREAARWLAEEWNAPLRQGDPNECSSPLWEKLVALGEPVITVDLGWTTRLALDYTSQKSLIAS